ncbi:DUF6221 family protein [Serinibacter arcticus]|uniref:Uncharacterized protein n=1 Tax=Serinibacter arcticus TaxID=1655435 RepID=A0A4Z1E2J7_9MICO|nr:DUF6221 family protein [Serinibacter arcticus]TGO03871.1 hypothetical protein SERN_2883 [Serinibacter arcticus]
MGIVDFLHARLDDDESAATAVGVLHTFAVPTTRNRLRRVTVQTDENLTVVDIVDPWPAQLAVVAHLWSWSPQRVLIDCETRRQVVEQAAANADLELLREQGGPPSSARPWQQLLQVLAAAYSDHPDYDQAWAPGTADHQPQDDGTSEGRRSEPVEPGARTRVTWQSAVRVMMAALRT